MVIPFSVVYFTFGVIRLVLGAEERTSAILSAAAAVRLPLLLRRLVRLLKLRRLLLLLLAPLMLLLIQLHILLVLLLHRFAGKHRHQIDRRNDARQTMDDHRHATPHGAQLSQIRRLRPRERQSAHLTQLVDRVESLAARIQRTPLVRLVDNGIDRGIMIGFERHVLRQEQRRRRQRQRRRR